MKTMKDALVNLLKVKSIVTLITTLVFAYQAITGAISQDFMTIYSIIIAFYFGTQYQKGQDENGKNVQSTCGLHTQIHANIDKEESHGVNNRGTFFIALAYNEQARKASVVGV